MQAEPLEESTRSSIRVGDIDPLSSFVNLRLNVGISKGWVKESRHQRLHSLLVTRGVVAAGRHSPQIVEQSVPFWGRRILRRGERQVIEWWTIVPSLGMSQ